MSHSRKVRPNLETLEDRCLLATATLSSGGLLTVLGTNLADTIIVRHIGGNISIDGTKILNGGTYFNKYGSVFITGIVIRGYGGNDTIRCDSESWSGQDGIFTNITAYGGDGDDHIRLSFGYDTIYGGEGNDKLYGRFGDDTIFGNGGNDLLDAGQGLDTLYGGAGNDILYGGPDADRLYGQVGDDVLYGGDGDDYLNGGEGNNRLEDPTVPFAGARTISSTADAVRSVATADLDGDGDLDVVSASFDDDKIAWYRNNGGSNPTFSLVTISTTANGAIAVTTADVNGDGHMDIVSASYIDGKIAWYKNNGGVEPIFSLATISTTAAGAESVAVADLDGDGDLDIISGSLGDDKIAWYRNTGGSNPTFTLVTISTTADGARSVTTADLDGDGDIDILSASYNDDKIAWYRNNGGSSPTFTLITISTTANGATSVATADLDGDGDLDVLSASSQDSKIAWYRNNGGGSPTFTLITISTAASGATSVATADLDGDGDLDVLSASSQDNKLAWYQNEPAWFQNGVRTDPTFPLVTISTAAGSPRTMTVADLDGDGDPDVLYGSYTGDTIAWHQNAASHRLSRLGFVTPPQATAAVGKVMPVVRVQLRHQFGQPVKAKGRAINITLIVGNVRTVYLAYTNADGIAAFRNIVPPRRGATTLVARYTGLPAVVSNPFQVT